MPSLDDNLSPRSLAQLALVISRFGPCLLDEGHEPSVESRLTFWQNTRLLERRWVDDLARCHADIDQLEKLAARLFLTDTVIRLWSTILSGLKMASSAGDMTRLARNAVDSIGRVRREFLAQMLNVADPHVGRLQELDKLRRRSERWTDLLLGPVAVKGDCFEFACDMARAREFGMESLQVDSLTGLNAYDHLASAGLQLAFNLHLSHEPIDEPELLDLMQCMLETLPKGSIHRDGTSRGTLERRIIMGRVLLEGRGTLNLNNARRAPGGSVTLGGTFFLSDQNGE